MVNCRQKLIFARMKYIIVIVFDYVFERTAEVVACGVGMWISSKIKGSEDMS